MSGTPAHNPPMPAVIRARAGRKNLPENEVKEVRKQFTLTDDQERWLVAWMKWQKLSMGAEGMRKIILERLEADHAKFKHLIDE